MVELDFINCSTFVWILFPVSSLGKLLSQVFGIELYSKAHHGLHSTIGQRQLHEQLTSLSRERSGNFKSLAFGSRQPYLKHS